MAPVWRAAEVTMEYCDTNHSHWEFPEWIPNTGSWHFLPSSDVETYLPSQVTSPCFTIRREGVKQESEAHTLGRFQSLPPHPERWDMTFFVGGPVWTMEWCPTIPGSGSCQYLALYCHKSMDDQTRIHVTKTGPALLQLWRLGTLDTERGGDSAASFSYGLAVDQGCIWDLKFCPSGGWEPLCTLRKSSHMPRLGLLAAAFSSGLVEVYSLPHPEALTNHRKAQVKDYQRDAPTLCKVDCVLQLQVGSIKSCGENGQCFNLAWTPSKPHQHLAAGFHDGTVSIWDLKTKSALQRVRNGRVLRQYPFVSFQAHEHAVRSIEWCKADSHVLVTAGMDRRLKFWDLRRLDEPIHVLKRILSTEISWVLPYCGVAMAQDTCYASNGMCGIHYVDSGFLGYKPYLVTPRRRTVWSLSGSDWLGSLTAGDVTGEVIVVVLPNLNVGSINTKRPADRRFPVYKADIEPCAPSPDTAATHSNQQQHFKPKSFRTGEGQYRLHFRDTDLRSFQRLQSREPVKRMLVNESKGDHNLERVQLEAIHRVRFCPNLDAHVWVSSGGHSGLVRVHCIRGLSCSVAQKFIQEKGAQFRAMFEEAEAVGEQDHSPEVQHRIVQV
uniref:General transcription factor 3C polypeptide 2 n=1 Tax=Leptobrachium leishanense TaxID=445787 RepID=A0A8C5M598_9ANUR